MSNNYYFKDKKVAVLEDRVKKIQDEIKNLEKDMDNIDIMFQLELNLVNVENMLGETGFLHIGQTAGSNAPLLEVQSEYYKTVSEMKKFYEENKERLLILDECDVELTWEELEKNLLDKKGNKRGDFTDEDGYCWSRNKFC